MIYGCTLKMTTVGMCLLIFQLVKGIRYTITVELSNTQCKKSTMLRTCDFYPESQKLKVGLCVGICDMECGGLNNIHLISPNVNELVCAANCNDFPAAVHFCLFMFNVTSHLILWHELTLSIRMPHSHMLACTALTHYLFVLCFFVVEIYSVFTQTSHI